MSLMFLFVMASITIPEKIGTNPQSILWLLPLTAAIVIVYKATKLPTITLGTFVKETAVLVGSIVIFITIIALVLFALAWLISG
ncbi:MAG: hypothetical protein ACE5NM_13015 [Sedimentisphaerales bacterium]